MLVYSKISDIPNSAVHLSTSVFVFSVAECVCSPIFLVKSYHKQEFDVMNI